MLKNDLRLKYKELRDTISPQKRLHLSLSIANKLLELPVWQGSYFHIFLPIVNKIEVDTSFILSILQGKDKNILLPKVDGENTLKHFLLTDNTKLAANKWGIPEPIDGIEIEASKIDVVFVPLLAFDKKGNRVGYGKGFYDTFLSSCKENVLKIGLSFFEAEDSITDISSEDISLDYCVTPAKTYSFSTANS